MNSFKRFFVATAGIVAIAAVLASGVVRAAPPYSQNTSGTTMDGVLAALTDLATGASSNLSTTTASLNCSSIKASPGVVYMVASASTSNQANFIKLFDLAGTPLATAQAPKFIFAVQASAQTPIPNPAPPIGLNFGIGIGMCVTGSNQATDNVNANAGAAINIGYK